MIKFLLANFLIGIALYLLTCIKYRRIQKGRISDFVNLFLFAPLILIKSIWDNL